MKTVSVKVSSDDPSDNSSTSVIHERRVGTAWHRHDGRDVVTNKDKDAVEFNLRPGDRLVVEAYPNAGEGDIVFDRDQRAAVRQSVQSGPGADRPGTTPVQNPAATQQPGADTSKPVGQANPRPTSSAPDRGPESTQSPSTAGTTGPASHPGKPK